MPLSSPMQSSLPAGWLAFTGRELNPLDRYKRFQIIFSSPFSGFILALGKTGSLHREAFFHFRKPEIMSDEIHQVGRIFAVMNCEAAVKADVERIFTKQARADSMEGPRPAKRIRHSADLWRERLRCDALDPALHFGSGAARKREQHHSPRVGSRDDQVRHSVGERVGLAGAGTSDDQK